MNSLLHQQYEELAQLVHQRYRDTLCFHASRWWTLKDTPDGPVWSREGGRNAALRAIRDVAAQLPDNPSLWQLRRSAAKSGGANHTLAVAAGLFENLDGLPVSTAPGQLGQPQAQQADSPPALLDQP